MKRQYKNYPLTSQKINEIVGKHIQAIFLKPVKLKNPRINLMIEIVKGMAYIGYQRVQGFGGLPVGTSEHALSMISSGIDSPVASFEMLKRGVNLSYIHFHSVPATNRQSIKNVEEILQILSGYQVYCKLYMVPFLSIQQRIMEKSPNKLWVILFRRAMVRIASIIAKEINAPALISGESVGQVASQTLTNIRATSEVSDRPILRPLCGRNKEDIIKLAQKIGTYDISVEPYEDCCSFFVPTHPETKANLNFIHKIESNISYDSLLSDTLSKIINTTINNIKYIKNKKLSLSKIND